MPDRIQAFALDAFDMLRWEGSNQHLDLAFYFLLLLYHALDFLLDVADVRHHHVLKQQHGYRVKNNTPMCI